MKHQTESALKMIRPIVLNFGDYSLDVMRLQKAMATLGFYDGLFDGYFGTNTLEALACMQEYLELEISEQFDLLTWEALNHWLPAKLHRKACRLVGVAFDEDYVRESEFEDLNKFINFAAS